MDISQAKEQIRKTCIAYLDLKPDDFYRVETKGRTRNFVTARAWMDLSNICKLYEQHGLEIDADLRVHVDAPFARAHADSPCDGSDVGRLGRVRVELQQVQDVASGGRVTLVGGIRNRHNPFVEHD